MISNGIDIVRIDKFSSIANSDVLLNKMFTKNEINYFNNHRNIQTLAGIYAAKEAFLKSIGKGINDYSLLDIEVSHYESGMPYLILYNELKNDYPLDNHSLSISHDGDYAIAIVSVLK